VLDKQIRFI